MCKIHNMIQHVKTFNLQSANYAKFRPGYPKDFYQFLINQIDNKDKLWDCACGNGQVAIELVDEFKQIYATDININQLKNAFKHHKISYQLMPAEKTGFANDFFDLVCVGQALHWFDIPVFFKEVERVLKNKGVLAIFGYGFFKVNKELDPILEEVLYSKIKDYWSVRNLLVINNFKDINFPFEKIESPQFNINLNWELSDMIAYISTWSAVKLYNSRNKDKIENSIFEELSKYWKGAQNINMEMFTFIRRKIT